MHIVSTATAGKNLIHCNCLISKTLLYLRNVTLKIKAMMKEPNINLDEYMPSTKPSKAPAPTIDDEEEDAKYEYVCVNKEHLIARAMAGYWQIQNGQYTDSVEMFKKLRERYKMEAV